MNIQHPKGSAAAVVELDDALDQPPAPIAPPADAQSLMAFLTEAARDPNVDIDKYDRLLAMYERVKASSAEQAYLEAMAQVQKDLPAVVRDADNKQTASKYARLETISAAVDPIIHGHGFSLSFGTDEARIDGHAGVTCVVGHRDGHKQTYRADVPLDAAGIQGKVNKTPTHAFGSTMTYARRYLKLMIFDISLKNEDDDGNGAGSELIGEEQLSELQDVIDEHGANIEKFCAFMGVEALADIAARDFGKAKQAILDWARRARQ